MRVPIWYILRPQRASLDTWSLRDHGHQEYKRYFKSLKVCADDILHAHTDKHTYDLWIVFA